MFYETFQFDYNSFMKVIFLSLFLLSSCAIVDLFPDRNTQTNIENLKEDVVYKKIEENIINKPEKIKQTKAIDSYCNLIQNRFSDYKWGNSNCENTKWNHVRNSVLGRPLFWTVFGDEDNKNIDTNTTMILCTVHGDEITPVKFCFDLIEELKSNPQVYKDKLVVVAPIVCPDCFFKSKPTRTNARGVDLNRNFPTKDWQANAIKYWKQRHASDKRRFPGKSSLSEPGTLFQVNLILRYKPSKIVSVHSPLTMLDYDGPSIAKRTHKEKLTEQGENAKKLLLEMSKLAKDYKVSDYPFFPGSLGNWAGNEKKIPTYTLELPNTDWTKTNQYWSMFKDSILHAISWDVNFQKVVKK